MKKRIYLLLIALCVSVASFCGESQDEARRVFEKAYNQVFGPQGCTLHYDVNLVGVYKTNGTIWYKGKKSKFVDDRADSWNDGVTMYTVYRKKKVIEVNDATSDKRDKYSAKFKFTLDDFDYSMERVNAGIMITLKQRRGARGTVKQAKALIDAQTYAPILVKVKVSLFWANIRISDFKSGGISDDLFVFPAANYGSEYKYNDRR
ncbi:MAG: hypothetical protein K5896_07955 [Prevotella sp.]|nr:hypothetical protein [Prevotella sp.]